MSSKDSFIADLKQLRRIDDPGLYGEVRCCPLNNNTECAVKIIDLNHYFQSIGKTVDNQNRNIHFKEIKERLKIIKELTNKNSNINKYLEETDKENKLYIKMELCEHNLNTYLNEKKGKEKEKEKGMDIGGIYDILSQLNNVFEAMNKKDISHGNIKLNNILVEKEHNRNTFKLSGFEITPKLINLTKKYRAQEICNYLPPEILEKKEDFAIDQKTDLWSLGVIIYYLFFREFPFKGQSCLEVLNSIKQYEIKKTNFFELDNLIERLLCPKKENRLTWEEYLIHPFFTENGFWKGYNVVIKIGQGLLSSVYYVKNKNDQRKYALKIIDFRKIGSLKPKPNTLQKDIIEEIKEKISQMKRLGDKNPVNFVRIFEEFEIKDGIAFTMELKI